MKHRIYTYSFQSLHLTRRGIGGNRGNGGGPTITDTLPYPLPDFLQKVIARKKSTEDADLLLLGALAVISACLPGISGEYDELVFYPNFFLFVTGNASAGKGRLSLCRAIAEPIHEALREQNEAENADYEKQLAAYNASKNMQNLDEPKTAEKYITAWCKAGQLVRIAQGKYEKSG